MGGIGGRGKIKLVSASTPSANEPDKYLILVHTVQLKPMIKAQIMVSNGISDVATASVHFEKTRLKNLMMMIIIIIIIMKSQETTVFLRAPEIDFRYDRTCLHLWKRTNLLYR